MASATFRILEASREASINKTALCADHGRPVVADYVRACAEATLRSTAANPAPFKIACIVTNDESNTATVFLKEAYGSCFMFLTGLCEAWSLGALLLNDVEGRRPFLQEAAAELIAGLGGKLYEVAIDKMVKDAYHAKLRVEALGRRLSIDVRPSDAIGIALVTGAPVIIDADVIGAAAKAAASSVILT